MKSLSQGALSKISIHALREEGDQRGPEVTIPMTDFYPRPPRGGRPHDVRIRLAYLKFLSTPSARRATNNERHFNQIPQIFLSTPSARRATRILVWCRKTE